MTGYTILFLFLFVWSVSLCNALMHRAFCNGLCRWSFPAITPHYFLVVFALVTMVERIGLLFLKHHYIEWFILFYSVVLYTGLIMGYHGINLILLFFLG
jgi:hypothetical protein